MNSPHICLGCRRKLSRLRLNQRIQPQTRASFISLTKRAPPSKTIPADDTPPNAAQVAPERGQRIDRIPRRPQKPFPRQATRGDLLESLFEDSLKPTAPTKETQPKRSTVLEPYKNIDFLKKLLAQGGNAADSWYFFVEHFGPEAPREALDARALPSYATGVARDMLRETINEKVRKPHSETLPSTTEVSSVYFQLGFLRGLEWSELALDLIGKILKLRQHTTRDHAIEDKYVYDLLGSWNVICREVGNRRGLPKDGSPPFNWSHLPVISTRDVAFVQRKRGLKLCSGLLAPSFAAKDLDSLPFIIAATFNILTDPQSKRSILHDVSPLVEVLARYIAAPGIDIYQMPISTQGLVSPLVSEYVTAEWSQLKDRAGSFAQDLNSPERSAPRKSYISIRMDLSFVRKRLQDAKLRRDARQVDELWTELKQWPVSQEVDTEPRTSSRNERFLTKELCNYVIMIYMGLRQPNRAIDVWNHMVNSGIDPNLATWDSMMSGCKSVKDWKSSEEIWNRMLSSGVRPDSVIWTTRISVLIESYRVEDAIRAMDEMGRQWLQAAKLRHRNMKLSELLRVNDSEGPVKPTIATINAVIVGLLRRQQSHAVHRVLEWAGKFGITPNVYTYNTLLRPLVRKGNSKAVDDLLQEMESSGVHPDAATFTIIMDETFRHSHELTVEEQRETVDNVLNQMEAAGIEANLFNYGKIIYGLLQNGNESLSVVDHVLEQMARKGIQPSSPINTMLVSHHFDQQPPNLAAVRTLLDRVSQEVGTVDHRFWDRVIEGYARNGDTASAVKVLGAVTTSHNQVSWVTMGELITALAVNEEWDIAQSIVSNLVLDTGGPLASDVHGREGQHRFWELARELKLVE